MILKGSQRAGGSDLAIHLMNGFDNERVEIAEIYGTIAGDLFGAFAEFEAVAQGTKAENYLYSLSINPPTPLSREQYYHAIQHIEHGLGLEDQPRAVVFHVKNGREHCHVVWSKIDAENMKAIHMAYDHEKLMDMSITLARTYGFNLTDGHRAWEEKRRYEKEQLEATLAEKAQADLSGMTPEKRRALITAAYEQSDTADAFRAALAQQGFILARGDRRGFVVIDQDANVHSLTRYLKGHKAKDVKARLAALDTEQLPGVQETKDMLKAQQAQAQQTKDRKSDQERGAFDQRCARQRQALARKHQSMRAALDDKEQVLRADQREEAQALKTAQQQERGDIIFRVRSAVADLIGKTPGLRSVLSHIQKMTHLDPRARHKLEAAALRRRHERELLDFARQKRVQVLLETRERQSLEKALRKEARLLRELQGALVQDFTDAARERRVRKTNMEEGDLSVAFNIAGDLVEGAHRDDGEQRSPKKKKSGWTRRADEHSKGRKPARGKGFGYGPKGD